MTACFKKKKFFFNFCTPQQSVCLIHRPVLLMSKSKFLNVATRKENNVKTQLNARRGDKAFDFPAPDDQWHIAHYWVLPDRLQNRPQRQTAGVGGRRAHSFHRWGTSTRVNRITLLYIFSSVVVFLPLSFSQRCLLAAMESCNSKLTKEEKDRNHHSECALYTHDREKDFTYLSAVPQLFPNIIHCHVRYRRTSALHSRTGLRSSVRFPKASLALFRQT